MASIRQASAVIQAASHASPRTAARRQASAQLEQERRQRATEALRLEIAKLVQVRGVSLREVCTGMRTRAELDGRRAEFGRLLVEELGLAELTPACAEVFDALEDGAGLVRGDDLEAWVAGRRSLRGRKLDGSAAVVVHLPWAASRLRRELRRVVRLRRIRPAMRVFTGDAPGVDVLSKQLLLMNLKVRPRGYAPLRDYVPLARRRRRRAAPHRAQPSPDPSPGPGGREPRGHGHGGAGG